MCQAAVNRLWFVGTEAVATPLNSVGRQKTGGVW
jgi:hypothetical protein